MALSEIDRNLLQRCLARKPRAWEDFVDRFMLSYHIPADPRGAWTPEIINADLHVAHNFLPVDFDSRGKLDLLVASFEGVSLLRRDESGKWSRKLIGSGNQQTKPSRGASEIKLGRLADKSRYLATIEPWHEANQPPNIAGAGIDRIAAHVRLAPSGIQKRGQDAHRGGLA